MVVKIVSKGPHGPYGVACIKNDLNHPDLEGKSITFSLEEPTWKGRWPEKSEIVILEDVSVRARGFRAKKARLAVPGE